VFTIVLLRGREREHPARKAGLSYENLVFRQVIMLHVKDLQGSLHPILHPSALSRVFRVPGGGGTPADYNRSLVRKAC
jgi:hypothetical protein